MKVVRLEDSANPTSNSIAYQLEPQLSVEEFIDVLVRSTLGERRPIQDRGAISGMLSQADIIYTARTAEGLLVGVSRALTDRSFCTYLSDLAVDVAYQQQGIGRRLLRETHLAAGLHTTLILLSAPKAQTYYPHIGLKRHESCWVIDRQAMRSHESKGESPEPERGRETRGDGQEGRR